MWQLERRRLGQHTAATGPVRRDPCGECSVLFAARYSRQPHTQSAYTSCTTHIPLSKWHCSPAPCPALPSAPQWAVLSPRVNSAALDPNCGAHSLTLRTEGKT